MTGYKPSEDSPIYQWPTHVVPEDAQQARGPVEVGVYRVGYAGPLVHFPVPRDKPEDGAGCR